MLKDMPLVWSSKLLSEICLSTAQAEHASLAFLVKALIPLRTLFLEVVTAFNIPRHRVSFISHAFEGNLAAYYIATADPPWLTSRSKHWNVKYHWFRSHLGEDKGILAKPILKCKNQIFSLSGKHKTLLRGSGRC